MAVSLAYLNETLQKDYLPGFKELNKRNCHISTN